MATEDLKVNVTLDSSGAIKGVEGTKRAVADFNKAVKKADKELQKSAKSMESSFSKVGAAVVSLNQGFQLVGGVVGSFTSQFSQLTQAFAVQEKAEKELQNALALTGQLTQENFEALTDYASSLQNSSTIGDEATLALQKRAIALGLNIDQTNELIQASADLSAATGKGQQEVFQQLIKSYGGAAGELGEAIPAIRQLTKEQLAAGEAIEIVRKQFAGFAAGEVQTFSGALQQAENSYGDLLEQIGQTIVETFDFKDALVDVNAVINEQINNVASFRAALSRVDFEGLTEQITVFGTAVASAFALSNVALIAKFAKSLNAVALAGLKFVGVTAAILGAAAAIDILIRNTDKLDTIGDGIIAVFQGAVQKVRELFLDLSKFILETLQDNLSVIPGFVKESLGIDEIGLQDAINDVNAGLLDTIKIQGELKKEIGSVGDELDLGFAGKLSSELNAFVKNFQSGPEKSLVDASKNVAESTEEATVATQAQLDAAKALTSEFEKAQDVQFELSLSSKTELDQIQARLDKRMEEIDAIEAALGGAKSVTAEQAAQLQLLRDTASEAARISALELELISSDQQSLIDEISAANREFFLESEQAGLSQMDLIAEQRDAELERLDVLEAQLEVQRAQAEAMGDQEELAKIMAAQGQVGAARGRIGAQSESAMGAAASGELQSGLGSIGLDFGEQFASVITNTVGPEIALTIAEAANVIGLVLKAPELINALAGFIEKILNFPELLLESLNNLGDVLTKFIDTFVSNIEEFIPKIIDTFLTIVNDLAPQLPGIVLEAVFKLVEVLTEKAPEIAVGFIEQQILAAPKIAVGIIKGLVRGIPALVKALILELPKLIPEIVEGLVVAVKEIFADLGGIFDLSQTTDSIEQSFSQVQDSVQNATENTFAVLDEEVGGRGVDLADRISKAIDGSTNRSATILERIWNSLKGVWDGIFTLFDLFVIRPLESAWTLATGIFDASWKFWVSSFEIVVTFFKTVGEAVVMLFKDLWDGMKLIFDGIIGAFAVLWDGVKLIFDTFIIKPLAAIWNFATTVFDDPIGAFKKLWEDVKGIFSGFIEGVGGLWEKSEEVFGKVFEGFGKILSGLWDFAARIGGAVVDAIRPFFDSVVEFFKGIGTTIGDAFAVVMDPIIDAFRGMGGFFKDVGNSIIDMLNGLIIPEIKLIDKKILGERIKLSIPGFDLIPGDIARLQSGGPVTGPGNGDRVPALLEPGEFVINRAASNALGSNLLNQLNRGIMTGGSSSSFGDVAVTVNVTTSQTIDSRFVKEKIMPTIKDEFRKLSIDGVRVVNPRGVRA